MKKILPALLLVVLPAAAVAQSGPKALTPAELNKRAVDVLRDLHDRGADLYNAGDALGAVRVYQTALAAVSPFVAHHPNVQKVIADGLAEADKLDGTKAKAFRLHEVIEQVRADLRAEAKKLEAVKPPDADTPKPNEPKPPEPPKPAGPALSGVITFKGKPVAGAEVTLVSLTLPAPRVFTAKTGDAGGYAFAALPPAEYVVLVGGAGVPAKYQTADASGLRLTVTATPGTRDLALQ